MLNRRHDDDAGSTQRGRLCGFFAQSESASQSSSASLGRFAHKIQWRINRELTLSGRAAAESARRQRCSVCAQTLRQCIQIFPALLGRRPSRRMLAPNCALIPASFFASCLLCDAQRLALRKPARARCLLRERAARAPSRSAAPLGGFECFTLSSQCAWSTESALTRRACSAWRLAHVLPLPASVPSMHCAGAVCVCALSPLPSAQCNA